MIMRTDTRNIVMTIALQTAYRAYAEIQENRLRYYV